MTKHRKELNNVDLVEFLDAVLGPTLDKHPLASGLAVKVAAADPDEQFCHVEMPSIHNIYDRPHVWRIDDWRSSYRRETQKRQIQHLERAIWVLQSEMILKLKFGVARVTCSSDMDACEQTAKVTAMTRSIPVAEFFGVKIHELLAADEALATYKLSLQQSK